MIWKNIWSRRKGRSSSAISDVAHKSADAVNEFASVLIRLFLDVRDSYRPELHYMRGPGPKWRAKHQPWLRIDPVGARHHSVPRVYARLRRATHLMQ